MNSEARYVLKVTLSFGNGRPPPCSAVSERSTRPESIRIRGMTKTAPRDVLNVPLLQLNFTQNHVLAN